MKFLLTETLDDEEGDARELALKAWGFVSDINPEQTEMVANAVSSILKAADDETLVCMGKILQFTMRLRKWIVYEHNKEKKSLLIPKMLKVSLRKAASIAFSLHQQLLIIRRLAALANPFTARHV